MKRLAVAVASCALALSVVALTGCSDYPSVQEALESSTPEAAVSNASLITADTLTVGINSSSAPYAWQADASGNELMGVEVDIAIALADEMGLSVAFVNVGSEGATQAGSSCDIVMGVNTAAVAGTSISVVGNYAESAPAVFARNATGIVSLDNLSTATVAVQSESSSAQTLATILPTLQTQGYSTLNDAFEALESGTVTYVVCDSYLGGYLAAEYDDISFVGALEAPTTRGIAVSATNATLQSALTSALNEISSNGMLDSIRTSWVGDLPVAITDQQVTGLAAAAEAAAAEGTAVEGEAVEGEAAPEGDVAAEGEDVAA